MNLLISVIIAFFIFFVSASSIYAQSNSEITTYTKDTLNLLTVIATSAAAFFIVKGGILYLTSTGKPDNLENAKKTLKNAVIGLVVVLSANAIISILSSAFTGAPGTSQQNTLLIEPITPTEPSSGLTKALIDAITGFLQAIVESATKPLTDGIMSFVTSTPRVLDNGTLLKFWFIMLGITDALFVVVVALLGLQVMSASTFGFEEFEIRQLLPRIGLAFLGAHISLFLADYVIVTCNALVSSVLSVTGGLNHAWIQNAFSTQALATGTTPLITIIFMLLFVVVAAVLLLFYISRLIFISLAVVLSPFIFLLWVLPKFSDMAEIAIKTYLVAVFTVFIHVVIIQLASAMLTLPENTQSNSLIAVLIAVGMFFMLLKTPSLMMQMVLYTSRNGTFKRMGSQIINVMSTSYTKRSSVASLPVKTPRKVIQ